MTELDNITMQATPENMKPDFIKWMGTLWFKPGATFQKIIAADGKTWWLPLVLLSVLQMVKNLVEISVRKAVALMATPTLPQGMQYITPDQQGQIDQSVNYQSGIFFTFFLPLLLGLAGIWITWLILSSILHISLTLGGSRSGSGTTFNITAWASLPIALRLLIQIIGILITQILISHPGFSGFITIQGRATLIFSTLLGMIDIFFILQLVYLIIGTTHLAGVTTRKAIATVVISIGLTMLLSVIPAFVSYSISGMNITRPFFF
jgi:hypothetical protein